MDGKQRQLARRILLPVGIGTALSLVGDASLYAVLPTHVEAAGIPVATVGILLSANRFVRLVLNGPVGVAYARASRRRLFILALLVGALSTAIYALTRGFWPLLAGRLLWGLAWAGIWVGGNTMMMEVSDGGARGRWIGLFQIFFFLGASGGALFGGLLTDAIGYHRTMGVAAALTLLGALIALACLPDDRGREPGPSAPPPTPSPPPRTLRPALVAAFALHGANRLVIAGVLNATLGLLLQERLGAQIDIAGRSVGVATLTGAGLGLGTLIAMGSAPLLGAVSDRAPSRWSVVAAGLIPGIVGFALLTLGAPWAILAGVPLTAVTSGSNLSLSTTLIGDLTQAGQQSKRLGMLFTVGDLASAVGPPLAYALIPLVGLKGDYLFSAAVFAAMCAAALALATRKKGHHEDL